MAFAGAFIWVAIAIFLLAKKYKIKYLAITDLIVSFLPFGLWLGRIWNYLNQELYGKVCPDFLVWSFLCSKFWTQEYHIANQLLESFFEW
jgi:phosphatidylglycerol:prolipoprotein diacylglycerol transferase